MLQTTIRHVEFPAGRRVIVISDIHGEFAHLQGLLQKLRFAPDDILVVNGDCIERGGENLRCIRYLMGLSEKQTVYTVCGNNDAFVWRLAHEPSMLGKVEHFCRIRRSILTEMRQELGLTAELPVDVWLPQVREAFADVFSFIHAMPTILETPYFTFVHAGLRDPDIESEKNSRAFDLMKFDDFLSYPIAFQKPLVVGHWPVSLYSGGAMDSMPYVEAKRRIISIDGGCSIKANGQLNAMILPDGAEDTYYFDSFDTLEKRRALDDQKGTAATLYFCWPDCEVDMLEAGERICRIRHKSTGQMMQVLTESIWQADGKCYCDDAGNGCLEIRAGEEVSVISAGEGGHYVKKDGRSGWYFGRLG